MQKKILSTGTELPSPNENMSVPAGLVRTVSTYEQDHRGGVHAHPDGEQFHEQMLRSVQGPQCEEGDGAGGGPITEDHQPCRFSDRDRSDEIVVKLWEGLDSRYRFENTVVNIDGSAVAVNGPEAELGAVGYPRDFRDWSRKQVEFLTAELQRSKIPFFMRVYRGNTSDPE